MTNIDKLSREYEEQYRKLKAISEGLRPLLAIKTGKELYELRKRIKVYYDMACECKYTASLLSAYYGEDEDGAA